MALQRGEEHYTMFTFVENGEVKNRRLRRIEIQDSAGNTHVLEGKLLPKLITVNTGQAQKGHHLGTILLHPDKLVCFRSGRANLGLHLAM